MFRCQPSPNHQRKYQNLFNKKNQIGRPKFFIRDLSAANLPVQPPVYFWFTGDGSGMILDLYWQF